CHDCASHPLWNLPETKSDYSYFLPIGRNVATIQINDESEQESEAAFTGKRESKPPRMIRGGQG
ncbi:MAG: hypothetical protein J5908_14020, partial [Selenomonas sp.]|nr:hypothetical protein [Selenomonas sp.]